MTRNILAVNFGGIGDEVLFLPALISLKKEFPNAKITLALEPRSKGIKELTNVIDEIITVDIKSSNKYSEIFSFIAKAIFGNYDLIITSGGNPMMSVISACTFIPNRIGYDTGALSRFLLSCAVPLNKNQYAGKMYHNLVRPVTQNVTELPVINITPKEKIPNSVLIHPGVSKVSLHKCIVKTVPDTDWAQLVDLLQNAGKHVILVGGPDDKATIEEIKKYTKIKNYENMYGKTSNLKELAELISSAEKFVCSDSAPMHIATGLGVKTYTFFGPTDDKKLTPDNGIVTPLKNNCDCPDYPCLWEKRSITCMETKCLKYDLKKVASIILQD